MISSAKATVESEIPSPLAITVNSLSMSDKSADFSIQKSNTFSKYNNTVHWWFTYGGMSHAYSGMNRCGMSEIALSLDEIIALGVRLSKSGICN